MPSSKKQQPATLKDISRYTRHGRVAPKDYYIETSTDALSRDHEPSMQLRLDRLDDALKSLGYTSVYEAALDKARLDSKSDRRSDRGRDFRNFRSSGGLSELYKLGQSTYHANGTTSEEQLRHTQQVMEEAVEIIRREASVLNSCEELRLAPADFNPSLLAEFSFREIYETMKEYAPSLIWMMEALVPDNSTTPVTSGDSEEEGSDINTHDTLASRQVRKTVVSLSVLLSGGPCNFLQNFFSYYLYASRVPHRVITIMNHIGVSMSRSHTLRILDEQAGAVRKILWRLCILGIAFQISFDNVNWQHDVRYERLHNQIYFASAIAGFILIPRIRRPMFKQSDLRPEGVREMTIMDFLPSDEDDDILFKSFRYTIFSVLKSYAQANDLTLPSVQIDLPDVAPLDPKLKPDIYTLPIYDLNESRLDEMVKAFYRIRSDIGMSEKQCKENFILFKGDLLTCWNTRSAKLRQVFCSPEERLTWVEQGFGLLHVQMSILHLLYRTHFGDTSQLCSLSRWIKELDRNSNKLWDSSERLVKNFNAALDFFEIVLDAYILAALCAAAGFKSLDEFAKSLNESPLQERINVLATFLMKMERVDINRTQGAGDTAHDNLFLFIQQGLVFRNFAEGIKAGDPKRCFASMSYFTVWLQTSNQWKYAFEMLRLTACMKKVWHSELCAFYQENCLVNLSGKRNGFLPCDAINERIVREAKLFKGNNATAAQDFHWRTTVGVQTLMFPEAKERMAYECDAFISDYHSTPVDRSKDIRAIASIILRDGVCTYQRGRDSSSSIPKQTPVADLFVDGQNAPAFFKRIVDLKATFGWDAVMDGDISDNDRALLDNDGVLLDRDDEWREANKDVADAEED